MLPRLYPNQKAIRIAKTESNKENAYAIFNLAALQRAMTTLNPSAFKLWCWLNKNQNGYEFALSLVSVSQDTGLGKAAYQGAVRELIEKKYLIEVDLYENLTGYLFIESGYGGE